MAQGRDLHFRIAGFALLLALGAASFCLSVIEQYSATGRDGRDGVFRERDPQTLTNTAKELHLFQADLLGAQQHLQRALIADPVYIPAWLNIAVVLGDLGKKEEALRVLSYVMKLTKDINRYRWDATLVAYQLGQMDVLPEELGFIISNISGKSRTSALELAFSVWKTPEEIVDKIGQSNVESAFNFAVQKHFPEHALIFWHALEVEGKKIGERQQALFIEMLMRAKRTKDAIYVWHQKFQRYDPNQLIFNEGFDEPFLGNAFGWRMRKSPDFDMRSEKDQVDAGANALHYRFKGWDNLHLYHLQQVVPIIGGKKYHLSVEMRSQQLTTDQRPYFEVYGYNCRMQRVFTEMVSDNGDWKDYSCEVGVPEECRAVTLRLRRDESGRLDNKLSGNLWIRKPKLWDAGENFSILDEAL